MMDPKTGLDPIWAPRHGRRTLFDGYPMFGAWFGEEAPLVSTCLRSPRQHRARHCQCRYLLVYKSASRGRARGAGFGAARLHHRRLASVAGRDGAYVRGTAEAMPETAAQGQPRDLGPGPAQKAKRAQAPACHWRPLAVAGCQWQRVQVVQVLPVTLRPQATLPGSEAGPRLLACHCPTCLCFPGGPGLPGPGPSESRQRHGGSEHAILMCLLEA
jgi:hypothetical protein